MRDEVRPPVEGCGVLNLDSSENRGTHWTAWYDDKYFDSYGFAPPDELQWKGLYNDLEIQKFYDPPICGPLCIAFIEAMENGEDYNDWLLDFYR